MNNHPGKMWVYGDPASGSSWIDQAGLPVTSDLNNIHPNDCLIVKGKTSTILNDPIARATELSSLTVKPWFMNHRASAILRLPSAEMEKRLRREGISARIGEKDANGSRLSVSIWGLDAVEMRGSSINQIFINGIKYKSLYPGQVELTSEHSLWKPVERVAVRALYALGLDYGQVELMLNERNKLIVTSITPELNRLGVEGERRLSALIAAFSSAWTKESSGGVQVTLGADPEFILLSPEGRIIPASRYFPSDGAAGCDSVRIRGEKRWPLVELRPKPSPEPTRMTTEVRRLLHVVANRTVGAPLSWRAGASPVPGLPLGGHLHLSGISLTSERLRALDHAIALPMRLLEPPEAAKRRPRYGTLGDVRRQPHGGFEYRTPPSWLVSPRLTLGVFALAKVAAEHSRELAMVCPLDEAPYREAFYGEDRELLLEASELIFHAIKNTAGYTHYQEPIDFVFDAITRRRSWDEAADIRSKWHIPIP